MIIESECSLILLRQNCSYCMQYPCQNDIIQIIFHIELIIISLTLVPVHQYHQIHFPHPLKFIDFYITILALIKIIQLYLSTKWSIMMQDHDLYSQKFNEQQLEGIYKYFNQILDNPDILCSEEQLKAQKLDNERQRVIKMDCLRTRSPIFDQLIKDQLQIMLTHYCRIKDIKYKQGLNQIAAPFIYFRRLGVPISKCEALFHTFFTKFCLNFYDDDNFSSIQLFIKMFSIVLKYHDPALLRYLEWHNIEPQLFCINWLMTFFASKLSFELVYMIWSFIATEKDKFLLFFIVLAIVQINRQNIIESKNINVLQVVTNLIFKQQSALISVIERALLLRKNTPSSIILFFRDRMIFEKRQKFNDVAALLEHMENLNIFMILPGEMTLEQHFAKGLCPSDCYFCDLRKPLPSVSEYYHPQLAKLVEISNDIRVMNFLKQYVIMDIRIDKQRQILHNQNIFKIQLKEDIIAIQQRFLLQFIEQKGNKHFVFMLSHFSFQDLESANKQEFQHCRKIIGALNSLSFPLLSILQGGFQAYAGQSIDSSFKVKKMQSAISQDLHLCSFQLPYSFPLKISDRCRLGTALVNTEAQIYAGMVEFIIIFDFFIFIVPVEKYLLNFFNYFEHNHSVIQYLYEKPHNPAELMVHRVISMRSLKKASMKIHNQNILVLLYDSCEHQQKRIFPKISKYLQMDIANFVRLGEICKNCEKKKNKIVIEMNDNQTVKDCVAVITEKYMQMRKKIKMLEEPPKIMKQ